MIDFITKLEDMLKAAGHEDWAIEYIPELKGYILTLDDDEIFITRANEEEL